MSNKIPQETIFVLHDCRKDKMIQYTMVGMMLLLLVVGMVHGKGDERTYLDVHGVGAKLSCRPANYGSLVPLKGIEGKIQKLQVNSDCLVENAEIETGSIILLYFPGNSTNECLPYYPIAYNTEFMTAQVKAVVVVNWDENGSTYILNAPRSWGIPYDPKYSICMISHYAGKKLNKVELNRATIHNGATEEIRYESFNARISVFVDDSKDAVKVGEIIPDTYRKIHVKGERMQEDPWFKIAVSDSFSSSDKWWCMKGPPPSNWQDDSYFPSQHDGWSFAKARANDQPTDKRRTWEDAGAAIWLEAEDEVVRCVGVKADSIIRKYGYEYSLTKSLLSYMDAHEECERRNSSLVTVHSQEENKFVASLITNHKYAAYIGLNDRETEGRFMWPDASLVDFYNWGKGQPRVHGDDYDCVNIGTDGVWTNVDCNLKIPSICRRYVGTQDDDASSDGQRCLVFLGNSSEGVAIAAAPKILEEAPKHNMCMFGNEHTSCCSTSYINTNLVPSYERLSKKIESTKCKAIIKQIMCFPCMSTQARYSNMNVNNPESAFGVSMNFCEDTCVSLWQSCQGEPALGFDKSGWGSMKKYCEAFNDLKVGHTNFGDITIKVKEADENDCFRIDGMPPHIVKTTPAQSAEFDLATDFSIQIQFDEQVRIRGGSLLYLLLEFFYCILSSVDYECLRLGSWRCR